MNTLPAHLQAIIEKHNLQNKVFESSYKVEDVTPAGYGPDEPELPEAE